jgi:hypothetical protein
MMPSNYIVYIYYKEQKRNSTYLIYNGHFVYDRRLCKNKIRLYNFQFLPLFLGVCVYEADHRRTPPFEMSPNLVVRFSIYLFFFHIPFSGFDIIYVLSSTHRPRDRQFRTFGALLLSIFIDSLTDVGQSLI